MDQATMQFLLDAARQEAEQSWQEGGIPIGAVLANAGRRRDWRELTLVTTLSPCPMCAGTAVLLGFRRVVIGERKSFQGAERWLREAGIEVHHLDDAACEALMQRMLQTKPELWAEDIGQ